MKKDPKILIEHILESIERIEQYTEKITRKDFLKSGQLQDSVIRRIEILGEATKNLSSEFKNKYPKVPWKQIAGMRDILIHEYFGVDLELTWRVVKRDVKKLEKQILKIKQGLK